MKNWTLLLCLGLFSSSARAEFYIQHMLACDDVKVFEKDLKEKYHEDVIAGGIDGHGNLVRVFSSGKTWTIVRTSPKGVACTFDAGDDWEVIKPEVSGDKT